jgi:hypothetical protein
MPYKLSPHVPQLAAKDRQGNLNQHIQGGRGPNLGPYIEWLNDEQRVHFLRKGLVIEIDGPEASVEVPRPELPRESGALPELVDECIRQLDEADVPSDAGAPTCRTALRDKGIAFGNDTIASAVRQRKMRAA